jgi:hypothetical protein
MNKQNSEESQAKKTRFRVNGAPQNGIDEHLILQNGKPLVSCLKGSKLVTKDTRTDRNGLPIEKQSKYKLTYVDKV